MHITVHHYEAFTTTPHKGNPAGVVFDAAGLTDDMMQQIAFKVGFNETTFLFPSTQADIHLRYFTPGHEMNLCGHATVASFYALHERNHWSGKTDLLLEAKAGLLPVRIENDVVWMTQNPPQFIPFEGDLDALMSSIGLAPDDLDPSLPVMYGSTGIWTVIIPVSGLDAMSRMQPDNARFPEILTEMPNASLHPICFETVDPLAHMHGRHFSSPYSGNVEDPVTGTASGVMGAYYNRIVGNAPRLLIEQGLEIGRDGRVWVEVSGDQVQIGGTAVYVGEITVEI